MTFSVDFDGVIHRYRRGWGDGSIYDGPVPGAIAGLNELLLQDAVFVLTSRNPEPVRSWLQQFEFDVTTDERCRTCLDPARPGTCPHCKGSGQLTSWTQRGLLLVTGRKLPALRYVDDRALRFESWEQTLADLADLTGVNG